MFGNNFDLEDTLTGSDLLAEIGLRPGAIQDVIDENHARRCPDPRDASGGGPLTVTAALSAGTEGAWGEVNGRDRRGRTPVPGRSSTIVINQEGEQSWHSDSIAWN